MTFRRFNRITSYNVCYTKLLRRWILNVPGNGADPCYMEDPQIIIQKWGGNLRTNTINLESDLRGVNVITSYSIHYTKLYEVKIISNIIRFFFNTIKK